MPMHALDQAHQLELFETARDTAIDHAPPTEPPTAFTPGDRGETPPPRDALRPVGEFWLGPTYYRLWLEQL